MDLSIPRVIKLCEEAIQNRPNEAYVFLEFPASEYHLFIKRKKPQLGVNVPLEGIRGDIISQTEGKVLVKYNAKDILNKIQPSIKLDI